MLVVGDGGVPGVAEVVNTVTAQAHAAPASTTARPAANPQRRSLREWSMATLSGTEPRQDETG